MDETKPSEVAFEARKPCIVCAEPIPAGAKVCSHCHRSQLSNRPVSFKKITGWIAGVSAAIGLFASLFGGVQWVKDRLGKRSDIRLEIAVAESQTQRAEYEAAVATYRDILQKDPGNRQAADEQVAATLLWVENFNPDWKQVYRLCTRQRPARGGPPRPHRLGTLAQLAHCGKGAQPRARTELSPGPGD